MAMRWGWIALLIAATLFLTEAVAQSKRNQPGVKQPEPQIGQPERAKEQPTPQPPPVIVNVTPAPKTEAERAEEAEDRRRKAETDTKLADYTGELAFFTKALFVATSVLGIATIGLLIAAFFQSRDTQVSIAAAQKAANIAERSLVEIQRALVVPVKFQCDVLLRGERIVGYLVTAILENTGTTVAKRFTGTANIVMWDGPLPEDFKYPDRTVVAPATAYVGPHVVAPYPIAIAIQDLIDIMNKKKRGFFYGWVEYDDVFSSTMRRRTEFCTEIEINGNPLIRHEKGSSGPLAIGVHGKYNAIDDDCFYKPGQHPPVGGLPPPTQPPPDEERAI
jgi:hypothetical protein